MKGNSEQVALSVRGQYVVGMWVVHGQYVVGTWSVHGRYVVGTVCGW